MAGIIPAIFVKNHPRSRSLQVEAAPHSCAPIDGTIRAKRCFVLVAEALSGLCQGLYWCARAARVQENQPMENSMKRTAALLAAAVSAVCLAGPASAQWPTAAQRGFMTPPIDQQAMPEIPK